MTRAKKKEKVQIGLEFEYRFRIFEGADGQTYVTIQHANGQALYTSEGYTRTESAIKSLENFLAAVMELSDREKELCCEDLVAQHTTTSTAEAQS